MRGRILLPSIGLLFAAQACTYPADSKPLPRPPSDNKVFVIGIGGVSWGDLLSAPVMKRWFADGMAANVALRDRNYPGDVYASIGAGNRIESDFDAGRAYDVSEQVDGKPAATIGGEIDPTSVRAQVVFPGAESLAIANRLRTKDGAPGALGSQLEAQGSCAAALGNADRSLGPVGTRHERVKDGEVIVDSGIHREVAAAAMSEDGSVPVGAVSRSLLVADPKGPFGIGTATAVLADEVSRAARRCRLVFIETGESARADAYAAGLAEEVRQVYRRRGVERTARVMQAVMTAIDLERSNVLIVATSSPDGPTARAQMRPMVMLGVDAGPGMLASRSTRRDGLLWAPDITALIRQRLGLKQEGHSHVPRMIAGPDALEPLQASAERARVNDVARAPVALAASALSALLVIAAALLSRRNRWHPALGHGLLWILAFPLVSYVSRWGVWRWGALAIGAVSVLGAVIGVWAVRRYAGGLKPAAISILAATFVGYVVDVAFGTPSQADSLFGYSTISAGRFFGLGNLGFALFASCSLLVAGHAMSSTGKRWPAAVVLATALACVSFPALGGDVGGSLALAAASAYLMLARDREGLGWRVWIGAVLGAVGLVAISGFIDLSRPPEDRTHLGSFIAQALDDPNVAVDVVVRKVQTSLALAVGSRWGILAPFGFGIVVWLGLRSHRWRELRYAQPVVGVAYSSVVIAAIVGTLVNDSGVAIAGMMMMVLAPWALIQLGPDPDHGDIPSSS